MKVILISFLLVSFSLQAKIEFRGVPTVVVTETDAQLGKKGCEEKMEKQKALLRSKLMHILNVQECLESDPSWSQKSWSGIISFIPMY